MDILWTIVIGCVVGLIARAIMPGRDAAGLILTILLGVAGAFLAGYLGQQFGWYQKGEPAGFIGAILGAMLILAVFRLIRRR
jgi:uncharacterized membrane protein YeaQ/YmgE (transglycosylase-associated protein family)